MGRRRTLTRLRQAGLDTKLLHDEWYIGLREMIKRMGLARWVADFVAK